MTRARGRNGLVDLPGVQQHPGHAGRSRGRRDDEQRRLLARRQRVDARRQPDVGGQRRDQRGERVHAPTLPPGQAASRRGRLRASQVRASNSELAHSALDTRSQGLGSSPQRPSTRRADRNRAVERTGRPRRRAPRQRNQRAAVRPSPPRRGPTDPDSNARSTVAPWRIYRWLTPGSRLLRRSLQVHQMTEGDEMEHERDSAPPGSPVAGRRATSCTARLGTALRRRLIATAADSSRTRDDSVRSSPALIDRARRDRYGAQPLDRPARGAGGAVLTRQAARVPWSRGRGGGRTRRQARRDARPRRLLRRGRAAVDDVASGDGRGPLPDAAAGHRAPRVPDDAADPPERRRARRQAAAERE